MLAESNIHLNDAELVELVRNGDNSALKIIIRRYESQIAGTVYGMLGNTQETDDVGQEVFIRFFNSIKSFRGDSSLGTYLTRIAINLSLNEIKKRKKRSFISWENTYTESLKSGNRTEIDISGIETKDLIHSALLKLSPKFRSVIVLRIIDEYSTEETAKILQLPLGTVLSRLSRAQQKLKTILSPFMEAL